VVSISNNIAEGFDRSSHAEFSRFLYFSLGSCSEVKSMLYLAKKFDYISDLKMNTLMDQSSEVSKILRGLIKSIEPKSNTHSVNKPI
jgi:four helix bundle protein